MGTLQARTPEPALDASAASTPENRVLDATKACCLRWGHDRMTIDDIAAEAGCSRATIYRLFPGGKDKIFEALQRREVTLFLEALTAKLEGASGYEDLLVRGVLEATKALRGDEQLAFQLAAAPGEVARELTIDGLPRIIELATTFLAPWFEPHVGHRAPELAEWLARAVISLFLAPSPHIDLSDRDSAARFVHRYVLTCFPPEN